MNTPIKLALTALLITALTACSGNGIGGLFNSDDSAASTVREERLATFKNATDSTLKVSFFIYQRGQAGATSAPVHRSLAAYVPIGGDHIYEVPVVPGTGINLVPSASRILRIKVETLGPSWEPPQPHWFEVLSPLPANIRATGTKQSLTATVSGGEMAPIPKNLWPKE